MKSTKTQFIKYLFTPLFFYSLLFLPACSTYTETVSNNAMKTNYDIKDESEFQPGKCYAKSLTSNEYETEEEAFIVYTGDESVEEVDVEVITVEISPAGTEWVKKKTDINCASPNPEDCLVWCLEEIPAETMELKVLKDTSQTSNYEKKVVQKNVLISKGGFSVWREVVCNKAITADLVNQIQSALRKEGYYKHENTNLAYMDKKTKEALQIYQTVNQIPVGNLDRETLTRLGVEANWF